MRRVRQWLVARATDVAVRAAPRLHARTPDRLAAWLARWGPRLPFIARLSADNMRAVGVYSPAVLRAHFAQLGAHFAGALHALRCEPGPEFARIAADGVELDDSLGNLRTAAAQGRGAVLMQPHITNYLLNTTPLNEAIPLTAYLRHSKDPRRHAAKEHWQRVSGVAWISEPKTAGGALGRLARMADAVRAGRVLVITPDLPQKREDGTPVRFFGREIYLPAGPALLAVRTGAPLFVLLAQAQGPRQRLLLRGPFADEPGGTGRDARRAAVQRRLQWFATCLEEFLRDQPALWYLWGDKRWTRVFRGDPRYVGSWSDREAVPRAGPVPDTQGVR